MIIVKERTKGRCENPRLVAMRGETPLASLYCRASDSELLEPFLLTCSEENGERRVGSLVSRKSDLNACLELKAQCSSLKAQK